MSSLLDRLSGVEVGPDGEYKARCPCHDDRAASLSIRHDLKTGNVLINCFGGCRTTDILDHLGFKMSDLFDVPPEGHEMNNTHYERREASEDERTSWATHYHSLIQNLPLNANEAKILADRGIPEAAASKLGYRSLSPTLASRAAKKADRDAIASVPGFIYKAGTPHLTVEEGLLCPIRDPYQDVVACQVRVGQGDRKYVWLSSRRSPRVAVCHWANNNLLSDHLVVVEGPIKADSFNVNYGQEHNLSVVGIPGVQFWRRAKDEIEAQEKLRAEAGGLPLFDRISIALDMDWYDKPGVKRALQDLYRSLNVGGRQVQILLWPSKFKGVDDYLAAGFRTFGEWNPDPSDGTLPSTLYDTFVAATVPVDGRPTDAGGMPGSQDVLVGSVS